MVPGPMCTDEVVVAGAAGVDLLWLAGSGTGGPAGATPGPWTGVGGGGPLGLDRVALGDGGGPHGSSVELLASEMESLSEVRLVLAPPLLGVLEPVLRRALAFGTSRDENLPARRMPRPAFGAMGGQSTQPQSGRRAEAEPEAVCKTAMALSRNTVQTERAELIAHWSSSRMQGC